MNRLLLISLALIASIGISASGYFIGDGLRNIKKTDRYVNVRGSAEREVLADKAVIDIYTSKSGNDQTVIFNGLKAIEKDVLAYLAENGLQADEIEQGQWSTSQPTADEKKNDPTRALFTTTGRLHVVTRNMDAAQKAYRGVNDLMEKTTGGVTGAFVNYQYTSIVGIRGEMIAAATKDARNAALQFAADSGNKVGSIRNASQGLFQITAPGSDSDDGASMRKNVRVVTTVDYELRD